MRIDGKEPFPPWLDHLNFLADRVMKLEALIAKLVSDSAKAPKKSAIKPKVKEEAPEDSPKKAPTKKAAPKKAVKT
jgi:hypothetical protein